MGTSSVNERVWSICLDGQVTAGLSKCWMATTDGAEKHLRIRIPATSLCRQKAASQRTAFFSHSLFWGQKADCFPSSFQLHLVFSLKELNLCQFIMSDMRTTKKQRFGMSLHDSWFVFPYVPCYKEILEIILSRRWWYCSGAVLACPQKNKKPLLLKCYRCVTAAQSVVTT